MNKKLTRAHYTNSEDLYAAASKLSKPKRDKLAARLLSTATREKLAACSWSKDIKEKLALIIPATIYIQDPLVAKQEPGFGLQDIKLDWEPNLDNGPTSARVAVVDYNTDTNELTEPARWDEERWCFTEPDGEPVGQESIESPRFHQVSVWAVVTRILDFFEDSSVLGRPVPWAFEGNRLIIVPCAGYGENAFYDRRSKSLQFYYCGDPENRVYTCLSHDIVAHETGHAILDGVRPYYNECSSFQTAAFHEFIADLTAILIALRNNDLRQVLAEATKGDLTKARSLADVAEQFSEHVVNREYLRSALNRDNMEIAVKSRSPHECSKALTGAMFDIMTRMAANYMQKREKTPKEALWYTIDRFTRVALQPLDYCPPVDIQFEDYVQAVIRRDQLTNPRDPYGYRQIMREVFEERQIPHPTDEDEPSPPEFNRYNINYLSSSRTAAYHFLNKNREQLRIPKQQDIVVADLYTANKVRRARRRLPQEIVLLYIWREDIELKDARFGSLKEETVSLLCGGTLVFDERGNFLFWSRKPGTEVEEDREEGEKRRKQLLKHVEKCVMRGLADLADEEDAVSLNISTPVVGRRVEGTLRLESTPNLRHWVDKKGDKNE